MCGIAGHLSLTRPPERADVQACLDQMRHRGPDDAGLVDLEHLCLGHRRLSIIDLSAAARQPFASRCGNYYLAYNGEIYNYVELRQAMEKDGVAFRTSSDTEVLLQLLIREGEAGIGRLNGMFAFAFYDVAAARLTLARDRFGKKPLYLHLTDSEVIFASELHPLGRFRKLAGAPIDHIALRRYFSTQFIDGERTIYETVRQLPAASYLVYENGTARTVRYWQAPRQASGLSYAAAQQAFAELLDDAVRIRMRSDVPVGAFLSGGIDSSVITALMLRHSPQVQSYSMGFGDDSYDESDDALAVAAHLGTRHSNRLTSLSTDDLLPIVRHLGQPMSDPSVIPFWELCRATREGVTVALSGDGADELLGGYKRYLAAHRLAPVLRMTPAACLRLIDGCLSDPFRYYGASRRKQIKLIARLGLALKSDRRLSPTLFLDRENARLLKFFNDLPSEPEEMAPGWAHLAERMMQADAGHYLQNDILVKVDRMSMAHSLEVRSPFLDYRVVELLTSLPISYKIRGSDQKAILRSALGDSVTPRAVSKPKHGFAVPVSEWLATRLAPELQELIAEAPEFIARDYCHALLAQHRERRSDHGLRLWSIYVFLLWFCHCRI